MVLLGILSTTYVVGALLTFWFVVMTSPPGSTDEALASGGWYAVTWPYWVVLELRAWLVAGRG